MRKLWSLVAPFMFGLSGVLACAGPRQQAPQAPPASQAPRAFQAPRVSSSTVVVDIDPADAAVADDGMRLATLGERTALVTVVARLLFDDPESAALCQALHQLQERRGQQRVRLVMVTSDADQESTAAERLGQLLLQNYGDAAYFEYSSRVFAQPPAGFGETLQVALEVSLKSAGLGRKPRRAQSDEAALVVHNEADALGSATETGVPALSLNGIVVLGWLAPSKLEALIDAELEAAVALRRSGTPPGAIHRERVAANAERVIGVQPTVGLIRRVP